MDWGLPSYGFLGYIFVGISIIICFVMFILSVVTINTNKLISPNDFALQKFTPTTIALFLFAIGAWLVLTESMTKDGIDEPFFIKLITVTAGGSILISICSLTFSKLIITWKAN